MMTVYLLLHHGATFLPASTYDICIDEFNKLCLPPLVKTIMCRFDIISVILYLKLISDQKLM